MLLPPLLALCVSLGSAAPQDSLLDDANRALDAAKAALSTIEEGSPPSASSSWSEYLKTLEPLRPLPRDREYALRVLYLEDDRLPALSRAERSELYAKVRGLLKGWYGYSVDIRETRKEPVAAYFKAMGPVFASPKNAGMILDSEIDLSKPGVLRGVIWQDFHRRSMSLIRRYFPLPWWAWKGKAVAKAEELFVERLNAIRNIPAKDGTLLYTEALKHTQSFPHWTALLSELQDADFILTNTVMAGADSSMPIYVIARGGITTGMVDNSLYNPYQAVGLVAVFPLLSDAPFFLKTRGEIPMEDRLDALAIFWMHELGHFFLRYGEAYGEEGCVHVAPEGLEYSAWYKAVRAKQGRCGLKPAILTQY